VIALLGLKDLLHRSPLTLSGGERQKVSLGRALLCRPKLLILDEPVSALDEPSRTEICTELRRIQQELDLSVMHIFHNSEEARLLGDRLGGIANGRLLRTGAIEELSADQTTPIRLE
jgi:ABC-type molybdate transport system ATPase subunit